MALATIPNKRKERKNRPFAELEGKKVKRVPLNGFQRFRLKSFRLKGFLLYVLIGLTVLTILGVANGFQRHQTCKDISVTIKSGEDNSFLEIAEVKKALGVDQEREIIGERMRDIDLMEVEQSLKENPFVKDAEVYKSIQGVLFVDVEVRKPIARLMNNDGSSLYLDGEGVRFPTTWRHSANVMLIRGNFNEELHPSDSVEECGSIVDIAIPVVSYISQHPFWNAQISEVLIRDNGELRLFPQIGDMYIEFGTPLRIDQKFENLLLFYHQVIKETGWKKYKGVSVKYKGQVIGIKNRESNQLCKNEAGSYQAASIVNPLN